MRCATHPNVETNLRCGKCGQPICPRCMVQTPVGARCRECANVSRLPIFEVSTLQYVIAAGVGLVLAIISGVIWAFIPLGGLFALFIALAVGYGIGELISLSVNRKRGVGLQAIAAISMIVSYLMRSLFWGVDIWGLVALALGISAAVSVLR